MMGMLEFTTTLLDMSLAVHENSLISLEAQHGSLENRQKQYKKDQCSSSWQILATESLS
jgi:hypothetical protein